MQHLNSRIAFTCKKIQSKKECCETQLTNQVSDKNAGVGIFPEFLYLLFDITNLKSKNYGSLCN